MRDNNRENIDIEAEIKRKIILFGGPQTGFLTNPKINNARILQHIEIKGQILVCIAQGGECRNNHKYYTPGMNDGKSWTTPIIDESCPNRCHYKCIVCDNHDGKCEGSIEYYPVYNKFAGQYRIYCREFEKFDINDGDRQIGNIKRIGQDPRCKYRGVKLD